MANSAKAKGDRAELEIAKLLSELTGFKVERKLGAGRKEDTGDLYGIPATCVQVKNRPNDPMRSIREGVPALRRQQANAECPYAFLAVRRHGGKWIIVMEPEQLAALLVDALKEK